MPTNTLPPRLHIGTDNAGRVWQIGPDGARAAIEVRQTDRDAMTSTQFDALVHQIVADYNACRTGGDLDEATISTAA